MIDLAALQDQLNAIQAQLDGMRAAGGRKWPQRADIYCAIDAWGSVEQYVWGSYPFEKAALNSGHIFRTEAEATRERDRRALIAELRRHPKASRDGLRFLCLREGRWSWYFRLADEDHCPVSGYFSEPVEGLIEQYGSRLDLLRSA